MKQNNWEIKELLPEDDRRNTVYQDAGSMEPSEYSNGMYHQEGGQAPHYGGYHNY